MSDEMSDELSPSVSLRTIEQLLAVQLLMDYYGLTEAQALAEVLGDPLVQQDDTPPLDEFVV